MAITMTQIENHHQDDVSQTEYCVEIIVYILGQ